MFLVLLVPPIALVVLFAAVVLWSVAADEHQARRAEALYRGFMGTASTWHTSSGRVLGKQGPTGDAGADTDTFAGASSSQLAVQGDAFLVRSGYAKDSGGVLCAARMQQGPPDGWFQGSAAPSVEVSCSVTGRRGSTYATMGWSWSVPGAATHPLVGAYGFLAPDPAVLSQLPLPASLSLSFTSSTSPA